VSIPCEDGQGLSLYLGKRKKKGQAYADRFGLEDLVQPLYEPTKGGGVNLRGSLGLTRDSNGCRSRGNFSRTWKGIDVERKLTLREKKCSSLAATPNRL